MGTAERVVTFLRLRETLLDRSDGEHCADRQRLMGDRYATRAGAKQAAIP